MGQKVNPKLFRIGQSESWRSKWFSHKNYAAFLQQDYWIRKFLKKKLKDSGLDKIEIERSLNKIVINIYTAKPGLIIGRGGSGIEDLKKQITKEFLNKGDLLNINIFEVDNPNTSAEVVLQTMINDIEKRIPFRRVMKQNIEKVMRAGALGVKITMAGRLNGAEIAREETLHEGRMPLHTIRANIDYSRGAAFTTYGAVGIKIWVYKGDVFEQGTKKELNKVEMAIKEQNINIKKPKVEEKIIINK